MTVKRFAVQSRVRLGVGGPRVKLIVDRRPGAAESETEPGTPETPEDVPGDADES
jgi:hypothetical protein